MGAGGRGRKDECEGQEAGREGARKVEGPAPFALLLASPAPALTLCTSACTTSGLTLGGKRMLVDTWTEPGLTATIIT